MFNVFKYSSGLNLFNNKFFHLAFAAFKCKVVPAQITIEIDSSTTLTCNVEYESGKPKPKTISYKWTRISSSTEIPFSSSARGMNSKFLKLVRMRYNQISFKL